MKYEVETINYHSVETLTTHVVNDWAGVLNILTSRAVLPTSVHIRVVSDNK